MEPGIPEWLKNKNLFITGATGYMGKVLLEKLLRCCPDIDTIFIISRPKRGLSAVARVLEFYKLPLFERLQKENPGALKKIVTFEGEVTKMNLGLNKEALERIQREVSVVFNVAASLKLEADLKTNTEVNTLGTLNVLELCKDMPNLEVFVHISTAFCHCNLDVLEEKTYPLPFKPREFIEKIKSLSNEQIEILTPTFLGSHPNSYTFTKQMTETLVEEYASLFPVTIVRPSIVTPTLKEPLAGWVDNLNGPVGVLVGAGKGVIRSMLCEGKYRAEVVPCDVAINAFIAAAWRRALDREKNKGCVTVYNVSVGEIEPISWEQLVEKGRRIIYDHPFEAGLWYPNGGITTNPFTHALIVFFFQTLPAYLIDFIMLIARQKRFLVRVQNRIALGMKLLQYFTMKNWNFKTSEAIKLTDYMNERDKQTFYLANIDYNLDEYLTQTILGTRVFCLKEPLSSLPKARKQLRMLYMLDIVAKMALVGFLVYMSINLFDSHGGHAFNADHATVQQMSKIDSTLAS